MKTAIFKIFYRHSLIALFTLFSNHTLIAQNDFYWVGGSGNWSDYANHWATTSGGSTFYTNAPEDDDNVFFDANSFTEEGQVVTLDDYPGIHDLDWRGVSFSPTIRSLNSNDEGIGFTGSVYLNKLVNYDIGYMQFDSGVPYSAPEVLKTNGASLGNSELIIAHSFVDFSLLDSTSAKAILLDQNPNGIGHIPSFSSNGFAIHALEQLKIGNGNLIGSVDLSNSALYSKSVSMLQPGINFQSEGASVHILYEGGSTQIDKHNFTTPPFETYRISADHLVKSFDPIFDNLIIDQGVTLSIDPNIAGVEFNSITANGEGADRITIKSEEAGVVASLIKTSGTVEFHNVDFQDIEAVGGATYNAYGSRNLGNVTGISFIKADQVITFEALEQKDYEDIGQTFILNASSTSGLELNYQSSNPEVASVDGNQLTIEGMGTVEITAKQEGDEAYHAATPVVRSFDVVKANQQISFDPLEDIELSLKSITLDATSSSNLPITYEIHGPVSLNNAVLNLLDVGTVQLTANQVGNENYNPAESVTHTFEIYRILGLEESIMIKAFPNPAQNILHVVANEIVKMNLYDLNGNRIFNAVSKDASFDLSTYPKGIYILSIEGNGQTIQRTILSH